MEIVIAWVEAFHQAEGIYHCHPILHLVACFVNLLSLKCQPWNWVHLRESCDAVGVISMD